MNAAAAASAHVCTPASTNPYNRPYKPRNYGRVVAGDSERQVTAKIATVDLSAFVDIVPGNPAADSDDATFWALTARADMIELQAACTLASQLRAANTLPRSLGRTLITLERLLRQKIRASITDHDKAGGIYTAQLLVELNAISVVSS